RTVDGRLPCAYFLPLHFLEFCLFVRLPALVKRARLSNRISADQAATSWKSVLAQGVKGLGTLSASNGMLCAWAGCKASPMASWCTGSCSAFREGTGWPAYLAE